jgi:hypothetical protein
VHGTGGRVTGARRSPDFTLGQGNGLIVMRHLGDTGRLVLDHREYHRIVRQPAVTPAERLIDRSRRQPRLQQAVSFDTGRGVGTPRRDRHGRFGARLVGGLAGSRGSPVEETTKPPTSRPNRNQSSRYARASASPSMRREPDEPRRGMVAVGLTNGGECRAAAFRRPLAEREPRTRRTDYTMVYSRPHRPNAKIGPQASR